MFENKVTGALSATHNENMERSRSTQHGIK